MKSAQQEMSASSRYHGMRLVYVAFGMTRQLSAVALLTALPRCSQSTTGGEHGHCG
jgi:hypothetical protein